MKLKFLAIIPNASLTHIEHIKISLFDKHISVIIIVISVKHCTSKFSGQNDSSKISINIHNHKFLMSDGLSSFNLLRYFTVLCYKYFSSRFKNSASLKASLDSKYKFCLPFVRVKRNGFFPHINIKLHNGG